MTRSDQMLVRKLADALVASERLRAEVGMVARKVKRGRLTNEYKEWKAQVSALAHRAKLTDEVMTQHIIERAIMRVQGGSVPRSRGTGPLPF